MAEEETHGSDPPKPEIPTGRVKRIVKLDKEINKVTSEAVFLVTRSAELFLRFIAEGSAGIAAEKKRRTIKLEDLRDAVKCHQPMSDFLLDSLPLPALSAGDPAGDKPRCRPENDKRAPAGTRRIDQFFTKPASDSPVQTTDP